MAVASAFMQVAGDGTGEILQVFEGGGEPRSADIRGGWRRRRDHRRGVEAGVATVDRGGDADAAISGSPRSWPRTRWSLRWSSGRGRVCRTARRLAGDHGQEPRVERGRARAHGRPHAPGAPPRRSADRPPSDLDAGWTTTSGTTCSGWCSPPATPCCPRGAGRADPAAARRAGDRGDRAGVPRGRADDRPAHRAGQADPGRGRGAVRGPARRRAAARGSASVLEVVYLVFNEGYAATAGDD